MNLLLLEADDFPDGPPPRSTRARIDGRRHQHVRSVLRAGIGDELCVGLFGDRIGRGRIIGLDGSALELDVVLDREPPPRLDVTLVLALPRPKAITRILALTASMGVARIYLINAWRVEKSFWKSPALEPAHIHNAMCSGLEQARDTVAPTVQVRRLFNPFVEDELPALTAAAVALVAHPPARARCPRALDAAVTLAVGPEGGFNDYELESLFRAGLQPVSLGPRVLRTEVAVSALLARIF